MKEETVKKEVKVINKYGGNQAGGMVYCMGLIGAAVYYVQGSQTFMEGVLGLLKALVWPAFLIYKVFGILGM
jgi:hypothetical protein